MHNIYDYLQKNIQSLSAMNETNERQEMIYYGSHKTLRVYDQDFCGLRDI